MVHNYPVLEYNNLPCPEEGIAPQRSEVCNQDDVLAMARASPSKDLLIVSEDYLIIFRNHADLISAAPEMPSTASSVIDRLEDRKDRFFFHHTTPETISHGGYTSDTLPGLKSGTSRDLLLAATRLLPHSRKRLESVQTPNISQLMRNAGVISYYRYPIPLKYALSGGELQADPLLPKIFANLLENAVPPVPSGITCGTA